MSRFAADGYGLRGPQFIKSRDVWHSGRLHYTSVQSRLKERSESGLSKTKLLGRALKPVAGLDAVALVGITEASYIDMVQWTGEQAHPVKRGKLNKSKDAAADRPPEILWSLVKHPNQWTRQVQGTERLYYRAIGRSADGEGERPWSALDERREGGRAWQILKSQIE